MVEDSSSAVKGVRREEDCVEVSVGRVMESRKEEQSIEEKGGGAHKEVKYCRMCECLSESEGKGEPEESWRRERGDEVERFRKRRKK